MERKYDVKLSVSGYGSLIESEGIQMSHILRKGDIINTQYFINHFPENFHHTFLFTVKDVLINYTDDLMEIDYIEISLEPCI